MSVAERVPAWCDPTLSREERIAAVDLQQPPLLDTAALCPCGYDRAGGNLVKDRYGYDTLLSQCDRCGTRRLFLRPTAEWYANFYASGTYRKLVSAYHGRDVMATIEDEQEQYGLRLFAEIQKRCRRRMPANLLDVGGSTGCVVLPWAACGWHATLVDPAAEAERHELLYPIQESFEAWKPDDTYEVVLLCQTIDHLLEPRACLEKIRGLLASDGLFFVDILDTEQEVAEKGWQQTLKIDHCFYLSDKSARLLLDATGFEIVDSWESAKNHIGYLCKGRA